MIIKTRNLTESLEKKYKLNESFVEEWWGQTDEDPFEFAQEYGLKVTPLKKYQDETLYRFSGSLRDIDRAMDDGYFYSIKMGYDYENPASRERHSKDIDELLNEAYEYETDDELDYIMSDDSLSDEEKEKSIDDVLAKYDEENNIVDESLNEAQLNEYIDDEEFQWFVGDNQSGYMYPNEQLSLKVVKEYIDRAKNTEGCEIISIVVVPQDGAGNDLL